MEEISVNKKVIAKNTLMLYVRMLLIMFVGLYTSRVVLQVLGVDDFGVYNVVGGFVAMLSYLNSVFVNSTQRFLAFTLGEGDKEKSTRMFSTALTVHIAIAIILLVLAESVGLWFVNNILNIDPNRMTAANWVYQSAVFSLLLTVISIPYKASIVAHEHMHIYAYVSILEAVMKLLVVFLLPIVLIDKLIVYSVLQLFVTAVIPVCFIVYCRRFDECKMRISREKELFKEMLSYSGWIVIGDLGFSFKDQLSNVIMNLFLGTAINAARGIATQVNGLVSSFAHNFTMALSPQITKQYAVGNYDQSRNLVYQGAKLSFYLMSVMAIPIIVNIDYILHLWLGIVPEYASEFVVIIILSSIIHATSKTQTAAIQATGNIKWFQIGVSVIMLLELPLAYFILKMGLKPYIALIPSIITNFIAYLYRIIILRSFNADYYLKDYLIGVLLRGCVVMSAVYVIMRVINNMLTINFIIFLLVSCISVFISLMAIYALGLDKAERSTIYSFVMRKINKRKTV